MVPNAVWWFYGCDDVLFQKTHQWTLMFILVHTLAEGVGWLWRLFAPMCLFGCSGTCTVLLTHSTVPQDWDPVWWALTQKWQRRYCLLKMSRIAACISLTVQFVCHTGKILDLRGGSLFCSGGEVFRPDLSFISLTCSSGHPAGQALLVSRGNLGCLHHLLPALWAGCDDLHCYFMFPRYVLDVGWAGGPSAHPWRAVTCSCRQGVQSGQNPAGFRLSAEVMLTWGAMYIVPEEVAPFIKMILLTV